MLILRFPSTRSIQGVHIDQKQFSSFRSSIIQGSLDEKKSLDLSSRSSNSVLILTSVQVSGTHSQLPLNPDLSSRSQAISCLSTEIIHQDLMTICLSNKISRQDLTHLPFNKDHSSSFQGLKAICLSTQTSRQDSRPAKFRSLFRSSRSQPIASQLQSLVKVLKSQTVAS